MILRLSILLDHFHIIPILYNNIIMNGHGWTWQLQLLEEKPVSRTMSPYKDTFSGVFGKGFTLIWL